MSAYLQMGHDTENLVGETDLEEFKGIILSPVNREPERLRENLPMFRRRGDYDIILDPQLYFPRGQREKLISQPYFPCDFDTTDFSTASGWNNVVERLAAFASELRVDAVASPVSMPRRWTNEFYNTCVETNHLLSLALGCNYRTLLTCLVSLSDLNDTNRAKQIASVLTRHDTGGYYVVIYTDIEPRRELADANGLTNLMLLISLLSQYAPVTIAYSSSDMILFKAAGAANCSTSKFFNLRRFTLSRFDEPPTGGGGQLPYWFEHNLLAFIREADIKRLQRDGYNDIIGGLHSGSRSGHDILDVFDSRPGDAWLGQSWRQYLSWFGKTEQVVSIEGVSVVREWLKTAETLWLKLNEDELLMDEPQNNGYWIRPWRQALRELRRLA